MTTTTRRAPRGFTLIELMIVVSIVGILSSIAIPEFEHMTLRARIAERETILRAIAKGVEDVTLNSSRFNVDLVGDYNPDASPGTTKRPWMQAQAGWQDLPLIIEGNTYCSYQFVLTTTVNPTTLQITGDCDIDGNGDHNVKVQQYLGLGHAFVLQSETASNDRVF